MSPTTRSPTSSSTPRVPSPTLLRHRTRTWMTLHSASYSLKYTENTPITAVRKVCLPVPSSLSVTSDRTGKPVGESSSSAQIRTLFDEQRQMIIAECCEKVSHHELQAAPSRTRTPNSTRRIMASAKGFS